MRKLTLFAIICILFVSAAGFAQAATVLHVGIPAGFDSANTTVVVGRYGQGLELGQATWDKEREQFICSVADGAKSVKILIYYPGCKIVTAEITSDKLGEPFVAAFQKLPVVPLTVQITGSDGQPIVGQLISLRQSPVDMEYFKYYDGSVAGDNAAPVASGTSDVDGYIALKAPLLLEDPLYAKLKVKPSYQVKSNWKSPAGMNDYNLVPNSIDSQKSYAAPIAIKLVYRAKISGSVSQQYLLNNGIEAKLGPDANNQYRVWFEVDAADTKSGQGVAPAADGTFSISVTPGTYDLSIQVRDDKGFTTRTVPVAKAFVVGENETRKIDL